MSSREFAEWQAFHLLQSDKAFQQRLERETEAKLAARLAKRKNR